MNQITTLPLNTASLAEDSIHLELDITDPEMVAELAARAPGRERDVFARAALRIGILALKQAQGRIDADAIRSEGERLIASLEGRLNTYQETLRTQLAGSLKEYFDPESGRFNERVKRLVEKDGELERVLRAQVGAADSELSRTLLTHLGENSPLMQTLAPDESRGFLAGMKQAVDGVLAAERERILSEFSLDNKSGALTRLVEELSERHETLTEGLQGSIKEVVSEFSLDNEDSALSRLVRRVEQAQKQISGEFSLDSETSALARMRRELLSVLEAHRESAARFQQQVVGALEAMKARKAEAGRSTVHGGEFEDAVFAFINAECQKTGDIAENTGSTTGLIRNCKVGDCVIELGRDAFAAGARIAVEAKENATYDLRKSLEETEAARKNRGAGVGLFVHSRRTAPEGLAPLTRHGDDVVVVWDAEDERGDAFLLAGLSLARALCARATAEREEQKADLEAIERAIREIEKQAGHIGDLTTWTQTIHSNSQKVLDRLRRMRESLDEQVRVLDDRLAALR